MEPDEVAREESGEEDPSELVKEHLAKEPEPEKPPSTPTDGNAQDVLCCFMVVIGREGGSTVVLDPTLRFNVARTAMPQDIYGALANCLADWGAMKTGEAVVAMQSQIAQRIAQQQQVAEIQQRLQGGGGITFPPR
jgi:hypothetical protein